MTGTAADRWDSIPSLDLRVIQPADMRVVAAALAGGIALDAGARSGVTSLGWALAVLVGAGAVVATGRIHASTSRACIAAAVVMSSFAAVRSSMWLAAIDVLGSAALLAASGALAHEAPLADLPARLLASRAVAAAAHGLGSIAFLTRPLRDVLGRRQGHRRSTGPLLRGIALAVPIVLVLGALLVSSDAVFASAFHLHLSLPDALPSHVVLIAFGACAVAGVLRAASAAVTPPLPAAPQRLGAVEWTTVLGAIVALFAAFTTVQVVTISGGARHVLATRGLTYAEYARSGYAQLIAVTVLTSLVLGSLTTVARRATPADAGSRSSPRSPSR
jgi:hypothetical protein